MGTPPTITPAEALKRAQLAARLGRLGVRRHADGRMEERNAQARDIRAAVLSATHAQWDEEAGTWVLQGGQDIDGIDLTVVVSDDGYGVNLVTVY